ncbi:MAG: hypothetical protein SFX72_04685 [Isosphaeraceae bacterium]|nr:hypothetical protein [Isosphaeraceae bacterium]
MWTSVLLVWSGLAVAQARPAVQSAPAPTKVEYSSFNGKRLDLFAWPGKHLVFFTQRSDLDRRVMARIVQAYDKVYAAYLEATSFPPVGGNVWQGRLVVAQVPETCGAGCGLLGANGIELAPDIFDGLYRSASRSEGYDHVVLYELGRNFWRYDRRIETNRLIRKTAEDRGSGDAFVNGFPIFMELAIAKHLRMKVVNIDRLQSAQDWWLRRYIDDSRQTVANTLLDFQASVVDTPVGNRIGSMDFFAAMMMRVASENGGWEFVARFWKEVEARPDFATVQDGLDNIAIAASLAAGRDLTPTFVRVLKWPVSESARAEVNATLAKAKSAGARDASPSRAARIEALTRAGAKVVSVNTSRGQLLLEVDANRAQLTPTEIAGLAEFPTIRDLNLYGTALDDAALQALKGLDGMIRLNVGGSRIGDSALSAFSKMRRLQFLELNDVSSFNDAAAAKLPPSESLVTLRVGGTAVGDAAVDEIARKFPKLQEIHVGATGISPNGFRRLAALKSLTSIIAYRSKLDDDALLTLARELPGLRYVNADQTSVTAAGVEAARRVRPGLQISR